MGKLYAIWERISTLIMIMDHSPLRFSQILNEFYNVLNRFKVDDRLIQNSIIKILESVKLELITIDTLKLCWNIKLRYKYSYFDSLIIVSALENNCSTLFSEDMQHGQLIENTLRIFNPFGKKE